MEKQNQSRDLEKLIQEFESAFGNFGKFHRSMDKKEKSIFKGWLAKMRKKSNPV